MASTVPAMLQASMVKCLKKQDAGSSEGHDTRPGGCLWGETVDAVFDTHPR